MPDHGATKRAALLTERAREKLTLDSRGRFILLFALFNVMFCLLFVLLLQNRELVLHIEVIEATATQAAREKTEHIGGLENTIATLEHKVDELINPPPTFTPTYTSPRVSSTPRPPSSPTSVSTSPTPQPSPTATFVPPPPTNTPIPPTFTPEPTPTSKPKPPKPKPSPTRPPDLPTPTPLPPPPSPTRPPDSSYPAPPSSTDSPSLPTPTDSSTHQISVVRRSSSALEPLVLNVVPGI